MRARHSHKTSWKARGGACAPAKAHGGAVPKHLRGEGEAGKPKADRRARGGGNWISGAIKKPGALHKSLHVPAGEKIPAKKLAKAAHSSNPTTRRRVALAKTLKSFHH